MASGIHRAQEWASTPTLSAYWLPFDGWGNGLTAEAWAPIADIPAEFVEPLLTELRCTGIAAHAAPTRRTGRRRRWTARVWVDVGRYRSAEDTIRRLIGELTTGT